MRSTGIEVRHRLPRVLTGDQRIGVPAPIPNPVRVKVLCAYRYWQTRAGVRSESTGFLLVEVRSSAAILRAFTDAMSVVLADWSVPLRGPKPREFEFAWYLPENGRRQF